MRRRGRAAEGGTLIREVAGGPPGRGGTSRGWLLAAGLAALAAAGWLRALAVPYLALGWLATALALVTALRGPVAGRRWRLAAAAVAALWFTIAGFTQLTLRRMAEHWPAYEATTVAETSNEIREAAAATATRLAIVARAAVALPADEPEAAFDALAGMVEGVGERAVVLYLGGEPRAWAGTTRVPTDTLTAPLGVVQTPFYTVLYATAQRGAQRAVATALLAAVPPADSLALALDRVVAARRGARSVGFMVARQASTGAGVPLSDGAQLLVRPPRLEQAEVALRTSEEARVRGLVLLAVLLLCLAGATWTAGALWPRLTALGVALAVVAIVPLNALSNVTALFDPVNYFAPSGGPFTANAGALALSSALVLLALLLVLRARGAPVGRAPGAVAALLVAAAAPFLLRELARGVTPPPDGVSVVLWLTWQVALFLAATVVLVLGAALGRAALRGRGLPPAIGPALAVLTALLGPILWQAPGRWPAWYAWLWVAAVAALVLARGTRRVVAGAAVVAACGAMTLVWGAAARGRVDLAERDVAGLTRADPVMALLLDRFAAGLAQRPPLADRIALLQYYAASDLAAAGHPVQLAAWAPTGELRARLALGADAQMAPAARALATEARRIGAPVQQSVAGTLGVRQVIAVPQAGGWVTTVEVAPRSRLFAADPYAPLVGGRPESRVEPPYTLTLAEPGPRSPALGEEPRWRRRGNELHGDWLARLPTGVVLAHAEVELRPLDVLVQRGTLVLLLDLALVAALWTLGALADGGAQRWVRTRARRWARSYRTQLAIALSTFFVVPALVFTLWSSRRLTTDDMQARELLVRETLRAAGAPASLDGLLQAAERVDAPLLVYLNGRLQVSSDPLLTALAPLGRFLPAPVARTLDAGELTAARVERVGDAPVLVGYRQLPWDDAQTVLATPARASDVALDRRRRDFLVLVLFATAVGAFAAFSLSGVAARQLARPIGTLRRAALAVARGEREPELAEAPPREFQPVFSAFRRMAADLDASRSALEQARARTAAVLRHVASGVVAVDAEGRVVIANPAAERLLGVELPEGAPVGGRVPARVRASVAELAAGEADEEFDLELGGRQLHARLTPLQHAGGGVVLTLDDVTELARAQRVLAWGEMARQVAHEIKNPLTPIRLGVQHLRRAHAAGRGDFADILEQNVSRILAEIDRLDEIARAFSRYGTAPEERPPGEPTDVAAVARDVVELERLGVSQVRWTFEAPDGAVLALARGEELREVLLNLLENARLAHAACVRVTVARDDGHVRVVVADDGHGIAPDVLPRIFEPHFSTRTSGSGLGLAISRRLVEGWGGRMAVASTPGQGTEVVVTLAAVRT